MKNIKDKWLVLLIGVIAFLFISSAYATNNFVQIKLPKGVSIELPKNWVVISNDQRIILSTILKSKLDLAGTDQKGLRIPFAANYYKNEKPVGIINILYYPNLDLTQNNASQTGIQDTKELDSTLKKMILKGVKAAGSSVMSWEGTKKSTINEITVFVTEYHRKTLPDTGIFRVRLVRVFAGNRSFTLTVSYNEDEAFLLKPITDRIISSLKLTDVSKSSAVTSQVHEQPSSNGESVGAESDRNFFPC